MTGPTVAAGVTSSRAALARSTASRSAASAAIPASGEIGASSSGIQVVRNTAEHSRDLGAVRLIGVLASLEVRSDAVEELHEVLDDDRHVVGRLATHLHEAGWRIQYAHRQRLRTALAVGDAE